MIRVAYWDCPTGIAGDMCLGALVDAGVPLAYFQEVVGALGLTDQVQLSQERVLRQGQAATQVVVSLTPTHHHRHLPDIAAIIDRADLAPPIKTNSLQVFQELAEAEGKVHGVSPTKVHFHEVGALDAITDIVGTCAGLHWLGVERIYASALPKGGGYVQCEHGRLPVPTPAVLQLWQKFGVPVVENGIAKELVTPTGAAILVTLCQKIGTFPPMTLDRVGLGAGCQDLPIANILRLWIGNAQGTSSQIAHETIAVLETQIDDLSPQAIAFTAEELLSQGALDVYTQPVYMKKGRIGTLVTVFCAPERTDTCAQLLFQQTTTLGIRYRHQERMVLPRQMALQSTPWGDVTVKRTQRFDRVTQQPEYEDCARLAREQQVPLQEIQAVAGTFPQEGAATGYKEC